MAVPLATAVAIRGPWADVTEQVTLVEALGYNSVWIPEIEGRDAFAMCAALGARSERIGFATGIVPLTTRTPKLVAMAAATVAEMIPGRFRLGLGAGHRDTFVGSVDRGAFADGIGTIRRILEGGELRGVHGDDRPPIFAAALRPSTAAAVAAVADGLVLNWATVEHAQRLVAEGDFGDVACFVPVCVTDDVDGARHELGRQVDAYGRLRAYASLLRDASLEELGAFGPAGKVRERLAAYIDAGVTLPILTPFPVGDDSWASMTETWSALADRHRQVAFAL